MEESGKKNLPLVTSKKKKPKSIGQWVAIVCVVAGCFLAIGVTFFGVAAWRHTKTFVGSLQNRLGSVQDIKKDIQNTVENTVQQGVSGAVNSTISTLQPNTALSQNGVGNKTITNVKVKGKAVLITGVLAAPENTTAKLEFLESTSNTVVASMTFGTSAGQNTATVARLFTVFPGTYSVKIETTGVWNVTVVEK